MPFDWDRLRVFHAAAQAGSFTHAAESLNLSQSAVSRQVSALEHDVGVPLFARHARGLVLTEQGEMLFRTTRDIMVRLEGVRERLNETADKPSGLLKVTTTVGLGASWLTERVHEFLELYPDLHLQLILANEELDLTQRQADCALRLRQPQQPDLIQRRLFTIRLHVFASAAYLEAHGTPKSVAEFDQHRIVTFGPTAPAFLRDLNALETVGRSEDERRSPTLQINDLLAIRRAVLKGVGLAILPDYMAATTPELKPINVDFDLPSFDVFFCYTEAVKNQAKLKAFREFLFAKARSWTY
jgi:DNA-binding transcriptional LysR family regulator